MNINQQLEIEDLFNKINKSVQRNNKAVIEDEDLNKVRAFVVQSQRPLQAVRLLQKEREERDIDMRFNQQKQEIINKAQTLDEERKQFLVKQNQMIAQVHTDIDIMAKNQQKRKKEDEKLQAAQKTVSNHIQTVEELEKSIAERERTLELRQQQLDNHKKFTEFLEQAIRDKELGESSEVNIDWIKSRFMNLKNENKKLKSKKSQIAQEMEDARLEEKETLSSLQNQLYDRQKEMQKLQTNLESIAEHNSALEQDFANEINKKNANSKQVGQIFNSINNIFMIVERLAHDRNRPLRQRVEIRETTEKDPELIENMIWILTTGKEYLSDLVAVSNTMKFNQADMDAFLTSKVKVKETKESQQSKGAAQTSGTGHDKSNTGHQ